MGFYYVVSCMGEWEGIACEVAHQRNVYVFVMVTILFRCEILASTTEHEELKAGCCECDGRELHVRVMRRDEIA